MRSLIFHVIICITLIMFFSGEVYSQQSNTEIISKREQLADIHKKLFYYKTGENNNLLEEMKKVKPLLAPNFPNRITNDNKSVERKLTDIDKWIELYPGEYELYMKYAAGLLEKHSTKK